MNFSDVFIRRPVGTILISIGILLVGIVAYRLLPVASLPSVDIPTIRVTASRPGADPATMAKSVAAPLERRLGEIAGVTEITSVSSLGTSMITIQFDLSRNADGAAPAHSVGANGQLTRPEDFFNLIVRNATAASVRLSSVADIQRGVRNTRSSATFNGKPSVLLVVTKQAGANVIETVDRIYTLLPELKRWIPAGINIDVLTDRTKTIRASVSELQLTLCVTVLLVMLVVYVFLRRGPPTLAAGITVPLSLAGTAAAMWCVGFSIDNISLMALVISVGFVVDDAIVMIENVFRNIEAGMTPWQAARAGSRQIGFTVFSISLSLIAAFTPLLFMGGLVGRLFREFSVTLAFAIVVSTFVSLTVTPMICAHFVKHDTRVTWLDRIVEGALKRVIAAYAASLDVVLRRRGWTLLVALATVAATGVLFVKT